MTEEINVLHVASFKGNIGDNANHKGFKSSLAKNLTTKFNFNEFEIRQTFRSEKSFDYGFADLCNEHDLIVFGGGNFFELWVENSSTGTSIDIPQQVFEKINVPILFNALGVDPAQGASDSCVRKFRSFLDGVIKSKNCILSCRNDGSKLALKENIGEEYAKEFTTIPDAGFFNKFEQKQATEIDSNRKNVLIQLAGDMMDVRFSSSKKNSHSPQSFIEEFVDFIIQIDKTDSLNFIFAPHIFRDLEIIHHVLDRLPDKIRRENVAVAPYLVGEKGSDYIFNIYKQCDLVLGMRFHANVCSFASKTNVIGLVNYRQIEMLYNELDLENDMVDVRFKGFKEKLNNLFDDKINSSFKYQKKIQELENISSSFYKKAFNRLLPKS